MGAVIVVRFVNNMSQTVRISPGERVFPMPAGVVPRGGELILPREQRDVAARRPNPVRPSAASVAIGREHFTTFCAPCHGPEAKGGVTGPVATRFIPTPDLTNADLQRQRTDGYWHSYILAGGAVMPAYAEALSPEEAWHIVNFLRSVAAR
jgi:putative copper resistance protein D